MNLSIHLYNTYGPEISDRQLCTQISHIFLSNSSKHILNSCWDTTQSNSVFFTYKIHLNALPLLDSSENHFKNHTYTQLWYSVKLETPFSSYLSMRLGIFHGFTKSNTTKMKFGVRKHQHFYWIEIMKVSRNL